MRQSNRNSQFTGRNPSKQLQGNLTLRASCPVSPKCSRKLHAGRYLCPGQLYFYLWKGGISRAETGNLTSEKPFVLHAHRNNFFEESTIVERYWKKRYERRSNVTTTK